ncbi:MAG: DNA polymerase III subunit chi [Gammaproteobacteria bacterium]|nr:DNA polymerase III subunit chi [Gammaproteobacteria bacterium]
MSTVIFYLLAGDVEDSRQRFACKLAGDYCYNQSRTHILVPNQEYLEKIDEMLWQYPIERFVPHEVLAGTSARCLVTLSCTSQFNGTGDVLINATDSIPVIAGQFSKICEIVLGNERPLARERFRQYRSQDFELFHEEHDEETEIGDSPTKSSLEET